MASSVGQVDRELHLLGIAAIGDECIGQGDAKRAFDRDSAAVRHDVLDAKSLLEIDAIVDDEEVFGQGIVGAEVAIAIGIFNLETDRIL